MIRRASIATLIVLGVASCSTCRDEFVAELIEKESTVERDFGRAPEIWSAARTGDRFVMGDGVRTGSEGQATLALPRRARLLVKSSTAVRFKRSLDGGGPSDQIEMQQGEVTIESGALDLGVSTAKGVVRLAQGSSVRMRAEPEKTRFDVVIGRVEYAVQGETRSVGAGGTFELEVLGGMVVRVAPGTAGGRAPAPVPASASGSGPGSPPTAAEAKPAAEGAARSVASMSFQEPPATALVTLPVGETATIHDPAPPSDVRLTFSSCPEDGVLELDRGNGRFDALRVRGSGGEVRARIPRGNYRYRLRCVRADRLEAPVSQGRLTIVADAATRPLPLAPVTITADADGRRYTVSYQNRLPKITLRWPDAPRADAYKLSVRSERGGVFAVDSNRSSVTLDSGRIGEGLHQFWFETRDGKKSAEGLLQVSFDYAARTAYLTSPVEGERAQDGRSRVAGGTLIGSDVQVQGVPQRLDAQGRFTAMVDLARDSAGAYVRVQHRSTGIHYYLRRLR